MIDGLELDGMTSSDWCSPRVIAACCETSTSTPSPPPNVASPRDGGPAWGRSTVDARPGPPNLPRPRLRSGCDRAFRATHARKPDPLHRLLAERALGASRRAQAHALHEFIGAWLINDGL